MSYSYKAKEGTPIRDIEGLRKFLAENKKRTYREFHSAEVQGRCGKMTYPGFSEKVHQYLIIMETESEPEFEFVPAKVIDELI